MYEYLGKNIRYPRAARDSGIQGKVGVAFIVETDGSISNVKVFRGIGGGCDEEAERVVKEMPPWKPGINNGKPVRVKYALPVIFSMDVDIPARLAQGKKLYQDKKYEKAFIEFNTIVYKERDHQEALYYRAMCAYRLGKRERSCADFNALKDAATFKDAVKTKKVVCIE